MKSLNQVGVNQESLSRMRALVRQLERHAKHFSEKYSDLCSGGVMRKKVKDDQPICM
jgi:hypothetical protein